MPRIPRMLVKADNLPIARPLRAGLRLAAGLTIAFINMPGASEAAPLASGTPPLILELTDTALIARVWNILYPDSALPSGEYQILLPSGPALLSAGEESTGEAYLLRNGTEIGHVERAAWQRVAARSAKDRGEGWSAASDGPENREVPVLWKAIRWNRKTLLAWSEWPAEFSAVSGSSIGALPSAKLQYERNIDLAWTQKLFAHYLLGLEIHRSQFGGGLTRAALEEERLADPALAAGASNGFWGDAYWWWAVSAGVPGLKYTLALANQPLPEYYWLETSASSLIKNHKAGQVVSQWTGGTLEKKGNFAHTLDGRLGYLRAGFHFDSGSYRLPVEIVALDELPALFGTWGAGLVFASDIVATRLWMDIPDLVMSLPVPEAYPSHFRLAFLHLDLAWRSIRNFTLGASVRIRIENPIMNRPGA